MEELLTQHHSKELSIHVSSTCSYNCPHCYWREFYSQGVRQAVFSHTDLIQIAKQAEITHLYISYNQGDTISLAQVISDLERQKIPNISISLTFETLISNINALLSFCSEQQPKRQVQVSYDIAKRKQFDCRDTGEEAFLSLPIFCRSLNVLWHPGELSDIVKDIKDMNLDHEIIYWLYAHGEFAVLPSGVPILGQHYREYMSVVNFLNNVYIDYTISRVHHIVDINIFGDIRKCIYDQEPCTVVHTQHEAVQELKRILI